MKYIKFFMLMVAAVLIASCSSDDATYNSETGTTVGFTSDTIKVKESTGFFNVPIDYLIQEDTKVNFYTVSIIAVADFIRMDKVIEADMLPLLHVTSCVKLRIHTMNECNTAADRETSPNFSCLLPERFRKTRETLTCTHNNTAILTVLRHNFQHLRREVSPLFGHKPVLHLVHKTNYTLYPVFIVYQLRPVIQFIILKGVC